MISFSFSWLPKISAAVFIHRGANMIVSSSRRLVLEPTSASATHRAVDDSAEHGAADRTTDSSAAGECADSNRKPVVDRDSTAPTPFAAWIAVVTVNYTTAKNYTDDSADTAADVTATTSHRSVPATISCLCDRLRPRAGKCCLLNRRRSWLDRGRLDLVAHVCILSLHRRWCARRSRLVLRDSL